MKHILLPFLVALAATPLMVEATAEFDRHFVDKTMRVDYFHIGNAREEMITVDRVYEQGIWAGSLKNLIDDYDAGRYFIKVYDSASGALIFSKGFDSYFGEYKTSEPALQGVRRTYHESALVPFPKNKIKFTVELRARDNSVQPIFAQEIDPAGQAVVKESPSSGVLVFDVLRSGDPHEKVDIAFLAEGYTRQQQAKVKGDLEHFRQVLFDHEPYKSFKDRFNLYGVFKPSEESGTDEPSHGGFKNTVLGSSFDSLGSERYLLVEDNKSLRGIAAFVPYDALFIMVNQKRYGGGGIYNLYCTFTVDNQWSDYLFLHEFGHSFAGLGDEYYTSDVAYNEFYPKGIEPTEPNITALLDPKNLKWKSLATPGLEIPTPWEKAGFEELDTAYQKIRREINLKIAKMKREGAPPAEIAKEEEESERLSQENGAQVDSYLKKSKYWGNVGAFEGAGYAAQGLFRPMVDCLMFTRGAKPLCKVCEQAVIRVIRHYTE